ncbi:MAG: transcriptional regulator [Schumannella sp.]|nr:transcriptional regulator [Schumannella sp.]
MDSARFSPTIALLTLARAAEVDVARILEPAGLSVRKLVILQRLSMVPGATPPDLARAVGISADEVAPMLRAMTTAGLVRLGRDGVLSVSDAGSAALGRVDGALTDLDDRLFAQRGDLASELLDATTRNLGDPQD